MPPFKRILIANRGEIACRIIRACQQLEIETVAIYTDPDDSALHVSMADQAIHIGEAGAYLKADRIIKACRQSDADAVHPGFGFLSENADFAARLKHEKIVFIGPLAETIDIMGDKIAARNLAAKTGISIIPGSPEAIDNIDDALAIATEIGFPVMVKAAAGGGGKGMRIADDPNALCDALENARAEALAGFGDARVFIEKYIADPRHIEIQILADQHGHCVHFGERECSIQRRHQKIIEEAPSSFLDPPTRRAMAQQACDLARAVNYQSAGTVEFVVDAQRRFYFLEMNTRIQVEHPVTEAVYNVDLVAWMIRIAAGQTLTINQDDIQPQGWAIEARLYAEDPERNFAPSAGFIERWIPPPPCSDNATTHLRLDSGVAAGDRVSIYYDPMLAKMIAFAPDRQTARKILSENLSSFVIDGIDHNLNFLISLLNQPRFIAGETTTHFISDLDHTPISTETTPPDLHISLAAALAAIQYHNRLNNKAIPPNTPWVVIEDNHHHPVTISTDPTAPTEPLRLNIHHQQSGRQTQIQFESPWHQPSLRLKINDERIVISRVVGKPPHLSISLDGLKRTLIAVPPHIAQLMLLLPPKAPPDMSGLLLAPMPGLLISIAVTSGQHVDQGDELAIIEAMKMRNILRAERHAVIAQIFAKDGDNLAAGDKILEFA